jgi:CHASE3 domain sensor protein
VSHKDLDDDLRKYIDSVPPPPGLKSARDRLVARFRDPMSSAIHDIDDLQRQIQESAVNAAAARLQEERDKRMEAVAEVKAIRERFWSIIVGVVVIVVAAAVIGAFTILMRRS